MLWTGTNANDGTSHPVYFKIYGVNGDSTEWFKYDSFPLLGHKYQFTRCLEDVGQVQKLDIVRKSEDHSTPAQVSVDDLYYTYPTKFAYVACRSMIVDFIAQTYTNILMHLIVVVLVIILLIQNNVPIV